MSSLFRSGGRPWETRKTPVTAREILDRAVRELPDKLRDQPDARAAIQHTMGITYRDLGHYPESARLLQTGAGHA